MNKFRLKFINILDRNLLEVFKIVFKETIYTLYTKIKFELSQKLQVNFTKTKEMHLNSVSVLHQRTLNLLNSLLK